MTAAAHDPDQAAADRRRFWQGPDYGALLPLLARLPLPLAYALSARRGRWHARGQRDWVELALGFPYIGERTGNALRELAPAADPAAIDALVTERYRTTAREELEGQLAIDGRLDRLQFDLRAVQALQAARTPGRGLVVVLAHFDNLFIALVGLARAGATVSLMTSPIQQDPRVHPRLRRFFREKYRRYEEQMNGGRLLETSSAARAAFLAALARGEAVAVVSDTPASPDGPGSWMPWFGRMRKLPNSALRMALDTGSEMVALLCDSDRRGRFVWHCSPLADPCGQADGGAAAYAGLFAFLEPRIRQDPGKWWSAHLLQDFAVAPDRP